MFLYIRVIEFLFVIVFPCNSCLVCFSSVLNVCLIVIFKYYGLRQILSYTISVYIKSEREWGTWEELREDKGGVEMLEIHARSSKKSKIRANK